MDNNGWVKLHRKTLISSIWANKKARDVWFWCLMRANHEKKSFPFNGTDIVLNPGQFITGMFKASKEIGCTFRRYRTAINYLKTTNRITIKTTNQFSIISIIKWEQYQNDECKTTHETTNKTTIQRQTNDKRTTTNKNVKNEKKDIAAKAADSDKMDLEEFLSYCKKSPTRHIQLIGEWADTIKPGFETKGQWRVFLKRNLRPASDLSVFTDKQIESAYSDILKGKSDGWLKKATLETILKFLK